MKKLITQRTITAVFALIATILLSDSSPAHAIRGRVAAFAIGAGVGRSSSNQSNENEAFRREYYDNKQKMEQQHKNLSNENEALRRELYDNKQKNEAQTNRGK